MASQWNHRTRDSFALRPLVEEVARGLASRLASQQIAVVLNVPPDQAIVADRRLFRRAVEDLMLGAITAMPGGGELVLTSAAGQGAVELEIADSGASLSDDARRHPFDRLPVACRGRRYRRWRWCGRSPSCTAGQLDGDELSGRRGRLHLADPPARTPGGRRLMDAAPGTFGRLLEPWRSMSPAARWAIGLFGLIAVVVAGMLLDARRRGRCRIDAPHVYLVRPAFGDDVGVCQGRLAGA